MKGWWRFYFIDLKRVFTYRAEFWLGLVGNVASQFAVAYFVWKSIYASRGVESLEGFSFGGLMAYYLLAPLVERTVQGGDWGHISREIYEGGLNRYLVYPVSFFGAKFMGHLAQSTLSLLQLGVVLSVLALGGNFMNLGAFSWNPIPMLAALCVMISAITVQFAINACLEQLAFWAENVWSLLVMARMILHLAGGALLPLAFFPGPLRAFFDLLPFHCFIDLPTRLLLGKATLTEAAYGMVLSFVWTMLLAFSARLLWWRGMLRYSGAGM